MNKPIIELYEYEIHGHPNSLIDMVKYDNLDDSPTDDITHTLSECKRVSIQNSESDLVDDLKLSSCDPIQSITGGANLTKYKFYDLDNLYGNYKFFIAKNTEINEELSEKSKQSLFDNMNTVLNNQLNLIDASLKKNNNDQLNNFKTYIETHKYDNSVPSTSFTDVTNKSTNTALIQKLNITRDNKVILMGDFHGSYHTFFRNLCRFHRYNILNLDTFIINDPYKIVFLGDILDRGKYAFDILHIIFKLMAINNTDPTNPKIILNRGNHEVYSQYKKDGGRDEISLKLILESYQPDIYYKFLYLFNKLLCVLPSATIIICDNYKFWCSHGGFSRNYLIENIPDDDIILLEYIDPIQPNLPVDIRWSDFFAGVGGDYANNSGRNSINNIIVKYTYTGTMKFLTQNNINFIFRGHQDSFGNSVYFKNSSNTVNVINEQNTNIDKFLYYNNTVSSIGKRVYGPIARVIADKTSFNTIIPKIFPVLTISTNTDAGRSLTSDSFALLRFDINDADITDFSRNSLSLINSIRMLFTKNKNINKGMILKKNLETTENLFKKLNDKSNLLLLHYIKNKNLYDNDLIYDRFKGLDFTITYEIYQIYIELLELYDYYMKKMDNLLIKLTQYNNIILNKGSFDKLIIELTILRDKIKNVKEIVEPIINSPILISKNQIDKAYHNKINNVNNQQYILKGLNMLISTYNDYNN